VAALVQFTWNRQPEVRRIGRHIGSRSDLLDRTVWRGLDSSSRTSFEVWTALRQVATSERRISQPEPRPDVDDLRAGHVS
jgi:hypothetical protein